jgi:hypothetical protein
VVTLLELLRCGDALGGEVILLLESGIEREDRFV